jgi:hypothetical protein
MVIGAIMGGTIMLIIIIYDTKLDKKGIHVSNMYIYIHNHIPDISGERWEKR